MNPKQLDTFCAKDKSFDLINLPFALISPSISMKSFVFSLAIPLHSSSRSARVTRFFKPFLIVSPLIPESVEVFSPVICLHVLVILESRNIETLFATKTGKFSLEDNHASPVLQSDHMFTICTQYIVFIFCGYHCLLQFQTGYA